MVERLLDVPLLIKKCLRSYEFRERKKRNEAKNAVLEAAPYPPFPSSWGAMKKINIRISFVYGTEGWWFK